MPGNANTMKSAVIAPFTKGPPIKHVAVMTGASTLSLLALFIVDFVDMFFLSLLGEVELAAAIGYAGSILFFTTSISIGLSIGTGALVAQALGRNDVHDARHSLVNGLVAGLILTIPVTIAIWLAVPTLLDLLGASGRAHALATDYLRIIVPSMPILAIAMAANGALRAVGDARRSMIAMVAGGSGKCVARSAAHLRTRAHSGTRR